MKYVGVTGARRLGDRQLEIVRRELLPVLVPGKTYLLVGDATGVDEKVRSLARWVGIPAGHTTVYAVEGKRVAWKLQQRSKQLVDGLAFALETGYPAELHAFPNKPCPDGITKDSWKGSGTWGTIVYARSRGVPVIIHPLNEDAVDTQPQQLRLL
jgi:hypothetical protein